MSNYSKLYWLTRLDYFQGFLVFLIILCTASLICYYIGLSEESDFDGSIKEYKKSRRVRHFMSWFLFFFSLITVTLLPSKSDAIFIVAGGKTIDFIQSDSNINKIPSQTTAAISQYLDKAIKEIDSK